MPLQSNSYKLLKDFCRSEEIFRPRLQLRKPICEIRAWVARRYSKYYLCSILRSSFQPILCCWEQWVLTEAIQSRFVNGSRFEAWTRPESDFQFWSPI